MSKIKKLMLFSLAIIAALSLALAGCGGSSSPSPSATAPGQTGEAPQTKSAMEIAQASLATLKDLTTIKMDMDIDMVIDMAGGTQAGKINMKQTGSGAVDIPNKRLNLAMDIAMDIPQQGKQNMSAEIYTDDGWMYIKSAVPGMGDQWMKMKLTDELWEEQSGVSNMAEFLESAANVELEGSETVYGVDCFILKVTPDMNVLGRWVLQQAQAQQSGVDLSKADFAKAFKSVTIKEWVAKDSYKLMREQTDIVAEFTPEEMGSASGEFEKTAMDVSSLVTYHDFGQPVEFELPPKALTAQEIPSGQ